MTAKVRFSVCRFLAPVLAIVVIVNVAIHGFCRPDEASDSPSPVKRLDPRSSSRKRQELPMATISSSGRHRELRKINKGKGQDCIPLDNTKGSYKNTGKSKGDDGSSAPVSFCLDAVCAWIVCVDNL